MSERGKYGFEWGSPTSSRGRLRLYRPGVVRLHGSNALLTGAAGGLGRHLARALGRTGVRIVASGRRAAPLEELCRQLRAGGAWAQPVTADLTRSEEAAQLVERAEEMAGPLDLLINNAGVELPGAYTSFGDDELAAIIQLNLVAPMTLARHALPGMLARRRGHIVLIGSLAGRGGNAYNALYATSKAGLLGLARSLDAELAGKPVGVSLISPGLIARDGMYAEWQREFGVSAPAALRAVEPERVAAAMLRAIVHDRPEVLVTGWPMRPLLAVQELAPRLAERVTVAFGAARLFERLAQLSGRA